MARLLAQLEEGLLKVAGLGQLVQYGPLRAAIAPTISGAAASSSPPGPYERGRQASELTR